VEYIWFAEVHEQLQFAPSSSGLFVGSNRNIRLDLRDTNAITTGANWELNERKINYAKTPY